MGKARETTAKPMGLHLPTEQPAAGRVRLWAVTVVNPNIIPSLLANRGLIMLDGIVVNHGEPQNGQMANMERLWRGLTTKNSD